MFYGRAVDNKLLVAINAIGIQQATAAEATNEAVATLLDYLATYPDDGTLYHASNMVLAAHADAGFHNETKGRSWAGAHIFLSENDPFPRWNGAILTIAQVIKFIMTSTAEEGHGGGKRLRLRISDSWTRGKLGDGVLYCNPPNC